LSIKTILQAVFDQLRSGFLGQLGLPTANLY